MIETINNLVRNEKIKWSSHCLQRMLERNINRFEVINCITNGEVIEEYPDDFPYPSYLICGKTGKGKVIHVVLSSDESFVYIITAYIPNTNKFKEDLKTRRI